MTRQLRVEYPGAYYHVYARGNQKQKIFLSDEDRTFFLKCLRDACERFGCIVLAYCLMANHYHLFLKTPSGHLSRIMHKVHTTYAGYFNAKYGHCGHIFQDRYKCILVEADIYAQELAAYIHRNPVQARIVPVPEDFPWSNYREYVNLRTPEPWTDTDFVLRLFTSEPTVARQRYAEFVHARASLGFPEALREAQKSGILGSQDFLNRLKRRVLDERLGLPNREVPQLSKLKNRPAMPIILASTRTFIGLGNSMARNVAVYISHKNTDYSLRELGEFFHLQPSTITDICWKIRSQLPANSTLAQTIRDIEAGLFG